MVLYTFQYHLREIKQIVRLREVSLAWKLQINLCLPRLTESLDYSMNEFSSLFRLFWIKKLDKFEEERSSECVVNVLLSDILPAILCVGESAWPALRKMLRRYQRAPQGKPLHLRQA